MNKEKVVAYIDASNLKLGIKQSGWDMNYVSFRSWLRDKFNVDQAVLFMGMVSENTKLYNFLQSINYEIVFRPTLISSDGKTKGNVDGELILHIARDYYEQKMSQAVLVSGDGDYHCIVEFLKEKQIPIKIISPNKQYLSLLLKRTDVPIVILDNFIEKLKMKKPSDMP